MIFLDLFVSYVPTMEWADKRTKGILYWVSMSGLNYRWLIQIWMIVILAGHQAASLIDLDDEDILDLSYPFNNQTVYYPTMEQLGFTFQLATVFQRVDKQGRYKAAYWFQAAEHGGTHVDAPSHMRPDGITVERIPLRQLISSAAVLDVSQKARRNSDYLVTIEDIQSWETQYGRLPKNCTLFIYFGWSRKWPNRNAIFGTRQFPDDTVFHFPGLHIQSARWLLKHRPLKAIGTDGPSLDGGSEQRNLPVHHVLSEAKVLIIEFVANLDRMPPTGAITIGLPMKIDGGSGSPLRLIALNWNGPNQRTNKLSRILSGPKNDNSVPPRRKNLTTTTATPSSYANGSRISNSGLTRPTLEASGIAKGSKDHLNMPKINPRNSAQSAINVFSCDGFENVRWVVFSVYLTCLSLLVS